MIRYTEGSQLDKAPRGAHPEIHCIHRPVQPVPARSVRSRFRPARTPQESGAVYVRRIMTINVRESRLSA